METTVIRRTLFVIPNITLMLQCLLNNVFMESGCHNINFLEKMLFTPLCLCALKGHTHNLALFFDFCSEQEDNCKVMPVRMKIIWQSLLRRRV